MLTSESGGLGRDITVVISSADPSTGEAGTELQRITRLNTDCRGEVRRDLTLLQDYGAIRLTGFNTVEQGTVSTAESVQLTYIIRNDGVLPAVLMSAVKESPFLTNPSEQLLISAFQEIEPGQELTFLEIATIDLEDAAASNTEYVFDLFITGEGLESGNPCSDRANYFFRIN